MLQRWEVDSVRRSRQCLEEWLIYVVYKSVDEEVRQLEW